MLELRYPIPRRTPPVGLRIHRGGENVRVSTEFAVYLGKRYAIGPQLLRNFNICAGSIPVGSDDVTQVQVEHLKNSAS